ncbi:hypothetical protein V3C99_019195 [Haemonchus contortus]
MDGFAEANQLLNSALEELDGLVINGSKTTSECVKNHPPPSLVQERCLPNEKGMRNVDRAIELTSAVARDVDDDRSTKTGDWSNKDWGDVTGSDGSSEVESPPSDIPTSSSSLFNHPKIYCDFVKAIEEHAITERPDLETQLKIMRWLVGSSSPSPSMSTVSCPEYPELQEKLHRLAMARDSLSLQVSVLSEQVGAQKEKIRDLEALLAAKRNSLTSSEELIHGKFSHGGESSDVDSKKLNLMAEVSCLKLKFATLEQEKSEAERKLKLSQDEIDHVNQSIHGKAVQKPSRSQANGGSDRPTYLPALRENRLEKQDEELQQLRHTVQHLLADNEQKNHQIKSLRNALELRSRSQQEEFCVMPHYEQATSYDLNSQIRRLLLAKPSEPMTHSTSFPVRLCSSPYNLGAIQPSSSYTSSLSTASSYHSWSQGGNRHLYPTIPGSRSERSCRSPSSPAARQLAAELDELRRLGNETQANQVYATASLPRGMGHKASSTLALPTKKYSMTSGGSAVESDDEVARGSRATTTPSHISGEKTLKRDRTRSSIRNLFMKFTRSTSQDQNGSATLKKGTSRSASSVRFISEPGNVELFPPLSQFVDWKSEQLAEWMGEVGFAQYMPEVSKYVRSGRHFLNMNDHEYEIILGIRTPLHRKRLNLLLRRIEDDSGNAVINWDMHMTQKWLEDIGLPQYKEVFCENMIDGLMFSALTATDLIEMRVLNAHHFLCICRSVQYLKMVGFKTDFMVRSFDESIVTSYPKPEAVVHWTHAATCEWLRKIDLAEFTPNLLCAGTPGALMVYEPTFTAETLAEILQMPPHKTLLRRHLTTHFNQLLGQKIVAEKRDALAVGGLPQLVPNMRIKITKKGLSLPRKKSKSELCIDPNELLCSEALNHKYPPLSQT